MTDAGGEAFLATVRFEMGRLRRLAEAAIAQVPSDRGLHHRGSPESNSIAILMRHLAGNLRSRWTGFLEGDGERPDRQREREFDSREDLGRAALLAEWEAAFALAFRELERLRGPDLGRTVHIRAEPFTVLEALQRQLVHLGYHVGQIVLLAREQAEGWTPLSIPRGAAPGEAPRYKQ